MVGDGLGGLADIEALREEYESADVLWREAIAAYEKKLSANHPKMISAQLGRAGTLLDMSRPEDAERLLQFVYGSFDERTPDDTRHDTELLLVEAYEMLGREQDAARYRALVPDTESTDE